MGKSINPMCDFLKPKPQGEALPGFALRPIVLMSLQPVIPWRVALLHCPPPLHRLVIMLHRPADFVNHHLARAGEFSTGTMGNFQPDLTSKQMKPYQLLVPMTIALFSTASAQTTPIPATGLCNTGLTPASPLPIGCTASK